jgi:urease accessory protein
MIAGLTSGFVQFFASTHLLAVMALGLLSGQSAQRLPASVPAAFVAGLLTGSVAVATAIRENPAALALLVLAAIIAGLVVIVQTMPSWIGILLAFATGSALALNAPPHELTIAAAIAAQTGFATAAVAALVIVTFIASNAARPWQRIGVRVVGSWIAASAILVLALRLAR